MLRCLCVACCFLCFSCLSLISHPHPFLPHHNLNNVAKSMRDAAANGKWIWVCIWCDQVANLDLILSMCVYIVYGVYFYRATRLFCIYTAEYLRGKSCEWRESSIYVFCVGTISLVMCWFIWHITELQSMDIVWHGAPLYLRILNSAPGYSINSRCANGNLNCNFEWAFFGSLRIRMWIVCGIFSSAVRRALKF